MKHTWADPQKEWDGFHFAAYWLDPKKTLELPIVEERLAGGKTGDLATTVGEIYERLADRRLEVAPYAFISVQVTTETEKLSFRGASFSLTILHELLSLRNEGINPFAALWFWYDRDYCMDEPHESYSFFLVHGDKIVRECVSVSDYLNSGFDPCVFQTDTISRETWHREKAWREADNKFWYRKFYTECRTGQIMLLREDRPKLYDLESRRGPDATAVNSGKVLTILGRIHVLLWILVVLAALIVIHLWK